MKSPSSERGFTLVEALIGLALLLVAFMAVGGVLVESARINRGQQMAADVQSSARNCLSLIVDQLRSAGWNPTNVGGIGSVALDPSGDALTVFADLNEDGVTKDPTGVKDETGEELLIRRNGDRIEWQPTPGATFQALCLHITNDADGDGTAEPLFVANPAQTEIRVQVTAQSPFVDQATNKHVRYTVSSDVLLRRTRWISQPY